MVEAVEVVRKTVDIRAQMVRRKIAVRAFHVLGEARERLLQVLLRRALRGSDGQCVRIRPRFLLAEFPEDRLDPDHRVEDVRTGVALERAELVHIENIILRCLV